MTYTPPTPAQRIDAALAQLAPFDRMAELLAELRDANIRYARTQRVGDLLNTIELTDEYLQISEDALGLDLVSERKWFADEARRECRYDIREGCYLDDNDEPVLDEGCAVDRFMPARDRDLGEAA